MGRTGEEAGVGVGRLGGWSPPGRGTRPAPRGGRGALATPFRLLQPCPFGPCGLSCELAG